MTIVHCIFNAPLFSYKLERYFILRTSKCQLYGNTFILTPMLHHPRCSAASISSRVLRVFLSYLLMTWEPNKATKYLPSQYHGFLGGISSKEAAASTPAVYIKTKVAGSVETKTEVSQDLRSAKFPCYRKLTIAHITFGCV